MATPRYSQRELWQKLITLQGQTIQSLTGVSSHSITSIDGVRERYTIRYSKTGKELFVRFMDVYALYSEIYRIGALTNVYMKRNCKGLLGKSEWRAPGAAIFAVLPHLDENIESEKGRLYIARHWASTN